MHDTRILKMDPVQHGIIVNALNDLRNREVANQRSTEFVDELLLQAIDAPYEHPRHSHKKERERL